jgi:aryl-alcohol dehydrogenase-like predicted oxidoreductase
MKHDAHLTSRRDFLKYLAMLSVAGRILLRTGDVRAAIDAAVAADDTVDGWPELPRTQLGSTGFEAGRLIFGCGAVLSKGRNDALLDAAFNAGINVFDSGFGGFYGPAEKNLAPFLGKRRDDVFLISKAMVGVELDPADEITVDQAKFAATTWGERLDTSLKELAVDKVDAYYVMAANNPSLIASDEIYEVFEKAKKAGKVEHLGLSTHHNAQAVLAKAKETGRYSIAMIAVTPAGWYDRPSGAPLEGGEPMTRLQPFLEDIRKSGIALVGMKAGRYLAGRRFLGFSRPGAYDDHYDVQLLGAGLSAFQRSYAYVLGHGLDVVNADMQSVEHLKENVVAAALSSRIFAAS